MLHIACLLGGNYAKEKICSLHVGTVVLVNYFTLCQYSLLTFLMPFDHHVSFISVYLTPYMIVDFGLLAFKWKNLVPL